MGRWQMEVNLVWMDETENKVTQGDPIGKK
jgi:hypothetical protein